MSRVILVAAEGGSLRDRDAERHDHLTFYADSIKADTVSADHIYVRDLDRK